MDNLSPRAVSLKRGQANFELAIHQVTTTNLRRMFKVILTVSCISVGEESFTELLAS